MARLFLSLLVTVLLGLVVGCTAEDKRQKALDRAAEHFRQGDFEKARLEYQNVLQLAPDDPIATERLAQIWMDRGATFRALGLYSRVRQLSPNNRDAQLAQIRLILQLGGVPQARRELSTLLGRQPDFGAAVVVLTESVRDAADWRAAEEAIKRFQDRTSIHFHLATANQQRFIGEREKAVAALRRALAIDPKAVEARAQLASLYAELGRRAEADKEFKAAAEAAPLRSQVRIRYAGHLVRTERVAEALAIIADLNRQAPDYLPAWRSLAELALLQQRPDDAAKILADLLAREPADGEARLQQTSLALVKGDAKRAIEELKKFGQDFPGFNLEKYQLALAHLRDNDAASAITALREYVMGFPDNFEALLLLGQLQLRTGAAAAATETLQMLVSRRPDILPAHAMLIEAAKASGKLEDLIKVVSENLNRTPDSLLMWYFLGLARSALGQMPEARFAFDRAQGPQGEFPLAALALFELDLRDNKVDEAALRAQQLVEKSPKDPAVHLALSRSRAAQKRWKEALQSAGDALALDPRQGGSTGLIAQLLNAVTDPPQVLALAEEVLARFPADERVAIAVAPSVLRGGDANRLKAHYEKVLEANPRSAAVLNNLANLLADQLRQPQEALSIARRAHELAPDAPIIQDTLAWMLFLTGDTAAALPLAEQAVKGLSRNPELRYHLGVIQAKLGRKQDAIGSLEEALKFNGDFPGRAEGQKLLHDLRN
jgi:predicted Zn-dependent protease